jgi:hypothetical protein
LAVRLADAIEWDNTHDLRVEVAAELLRLSAQADKDEALLRQALGALEIMLNGADAAVQAKAVGAHWWHHGRSGARSTVAALRERLKEAT